MSKNKIIIDNLSKTFISKERGEVKAVNSLSLTCVPGEIFGLLGPNGAGKTTTLRMVATLLKPDFGKILINGYDTINEPDMVRKSIGYLSTTTSLYPRLTPREIITYFAKLNSYKQKPIDKRVEEVINYLGIGEFADTLTTKLSTGMKQITSIARTIVHDPPILILDEPSNGLDVMIAVKMHNYIKDLKEKGKTIIFSSHNMGEVEKVCDRIGIINKGKLLAIGTQEELREKTGKFYMEDIFVALVEESELLKK